MQSFQEIFRMVTEHYMQEAFNVLPETPADYCPWDINRGLCEDWANTMQSHVGGEVRWLDELPGYWSIYGDSLDCAHAVLELNGKFYDSQHPEGVKDWMDLDIAQGVTREEFLDKTIKWW